MSPSLGLASHHSRNHTRRAFQKLFETLDAVEPFFLHIDHYAS